MKDFRVLDGGDKLTEMTMDTCTCGCNTSAVVEEKPATPDTCGCGCGDGGSSQTA
jgi:hypothetical protein